uniref:Coatomer subunit gamma n=1 Tax=Fibrocapsa japonica TaxID=94617 RepID=A0A6U1MSQ3_9STRA|mmetsp:Transcript_14872/g.21914  ORF Transcript_14872/g.21914 Transcript_14872/m.21914 type:complete len:943 (+) Transcript_14872:93-2921(+)
MASQEGQEGDSRALTVSSMIKEIQGLKEKFKGEDDRTSPFADLEKAAVLQECRAFSDSNVVTHHPQRCSHLITKLLHILSTGDTFSSSETTEVFFGVTKLFQSHDANLRRMMYLFIKEVADNCNPDDVIIVTSSLTRDMNSNQELYKANSIRVLSRIIDAAMLGAIERYMKQAIVDKNGLVASSALSSAMILLPKAPDLIRRWVNEVQEALNSQNQMVQYHALSLLYQIKAHDKLAVSKLVNQLSKGNMRSPLGVCLLIRYMSALLHEDMSATNARQAYQFLENCLRHKHEMVIFEAARAICQLPGVEASDLLPAITVLQLFLSSPKPTLRFVAMRCLSEVAIRHPLSVVKCNEDMEALIADPNRSIATLAITTLLKTGSEGSVDRLMKQISSFMGEIADEFKVIVISSIRQLCLKYPQKHRVLIGFMATFLREEGGFEFKKTIVDSIVDLMQAIPETKESSLFHLCEFIEDCEFTALYTQILHLLGTMGPSTSAPARYIRFIYNRIILEKAVVRAAAVSALAKFAACVPSLRPSIKVLLQRSLLDENDEVRDRAAVAISVLEKEEDMGRGGAPTDDPAQEGDKPSGSGMAEYLLLEPLPLSFPALERSLRAYQSHPGGSAGQPLQLSTLPVVEEPAAPAPSAQTHKLGAPAPTTATAASASAAPGGAPGGEDPAAALYQIPELADLGRVFRSTQPVWLTESETEYVVQCVKHVFQNHTVLEFKVNNTIPDQKLQDIKVQVEAQEELYSVERSIPAEVALYSQPASCYVVLARQADQEFVGCTFGCELHFNVVEIDPNSGEVEGDPEGFPEEYPLEALELSVADHMAKVSLGDFRRSWENMGNAAEVMEKFALQFKKLEEAVAGVIDFLGMQACDGTASIKPPAQGAPPTSHQLHLSGVFVGNIPVLVRCLLQMDPSAGCVLKIAVRSDDPSTSQTVANCIG